MRQKSQARDGLRISAVNRFGLFGFNDEKAILNMSTLRTRGGDAGLNRYTDLVSPDRLSIFRLLFPIPWSRRRTSNIGLREPDRTPFSRATKETGRSVVRERYCQLLCSELSGGVLLDSVNEDFSLEERKDALMAFETMPAFLGCLSQFEHHREACASRSAPFRTGMAQADR